jgi:hypothetical protein
MHVMSTELQVSYVAKNMTTDAGFFQPVFLGNQIHTPYQLYLLIHNFQLSILVH